jgi:uncharacterized protein (DUF58 family)
MLIFLIVILLLAALLEFFSLRGGAASVDADITLSKTRAEAGEALTLQSTVRNNGRLPISYLALSVGFPETVSLPADVKTERDVNYTAVTEEFRLWGRQQRSRRLSFSLERRGVHVICGRKLARGDFLGLSLSERRADCRRELLVYPRPLQSGALVEALGNYCGELSARRWLIRDPVLTLGVREYTGTEPMHTISWSQTARRGALTIREFDYTRSLNCCVLLCVNGLQDDDGTLLDRCCSAARTVCDTLIANGVEASLSTNAALIGYPFAVCRSATASLGRESDVLDILARATDLPCAQMTALAEAALAAQTEAAAFVLIVPHADAAAEDARRLLEARNGMGALLVAADRLEVDPDG